MSLRFLLRLASAAIGAGPLAGCEVVSLSIDSGTGLIVVRLEDDGGGRRGGYRMRVRQVGQADRVIAAGLDAPLELAVPASGPVELTLIPPAGCLTVSANPRIVDPGADGTVTARFDVRCTS
jgi:hypothetical protein